MNHATLFFAVTPSMRQRLELTIENLHALLDVIDADADLEDSGDAEPEPLEPYFAGAGSDLEHDDRDYE